MFLILQHFVLQTLIYELLCIDETIKFFEHFRPTGYELYGFRKVQKAYSNSAKKLSKKEDDQDPKFVQGSAHKT